MMGQYNKTPKVHVVRDDFMSVSPTKKYMKTRNPSPRMSTSNKTLRKPNRVRRNWLKTNQNRNPGWKAERVSSQENQIRESIPLHQHNRETTKIQNRGSNPLGFFSTSMSPSRATLDQKHGPSSLPHAFCFFLLFCLHYSLSLLRKKYRLNSLCINTIELCDSLSGKEFRARF